MRSVRKELRDVIKGLKILAQKTEKIEMELNKASAKTVLAAAQRRAAMRARGVKTRGPAGVVARRRRGITATDAVYEIIKRGKKGVTTTQIKKKTGFDDKKIWNVINRLKTLRKIKSARRGIYVTR
jgi:DNA invertase Pin-like site-specific DNA recombinase